MGRTPGSKNRPKDGAKAKRLGKKETLKVTTIKPAAAARAAAAEKAKPPAAEKPFVSDARMTPGTFLKSLLAECRGFAKNAESHIGSMRERIAYGKEKKNLNTGVFGWLRKMDRMEPEKASEWHYTYLAYLESSGILAKIDAVERLPLGDKPSTGDEDTDGEAEEAAGETAGEAAVDGAPKPESEASEVEHANGGAPAANVSRPRFGQTAPKSQTQKAEEARLAAAGGSTH